jgi:glycosyltransferase involved in cell wall biosynthesis
VIRPPVAIVATYYRPVFGGAEAAAERLARYLHRRGHRVLVLTKRTPAAVPDREAADGVEIERLGPAAERSGRGKWVFLPFAFRALLRHRRDAAVVCCIDYRGTGLAALAARAWTGTPVVFQAQTEGVLSGARIRDRLARLGLRRDGTIARMATWPVRVLYRRTDAIACISHSLEQEALDAGIPRARVRYLPNPVDCTQFTPANDAERGQWRAELGVPADAILAVFVGRLSREKGVMELLRAWRKAQPAACLAIIGPPMTDHPWDVSEEARTFVEREGLDPAVRFLGGLPAALVARWLSVADFAVQPSQFEAMGLAAAEAMAAGLPVVASDTGGFRDFVVPGETGWLVPVGDEDALAATIVRLVTNAGERARWGKNARRRAEAFDERAVLEEFAQLIDRLAGAA